MQLLFFHNWYIIMLIILQPRVCTIMTCYKHNEGQPQHQCYQNMKNTQAVNLIVVSKIPLPREETMWEEMPCFLIWIYICKIILAYSFSRFSLIKQILNKKKCKTNKFDMYICIYMFISNAMKEKLIDLALLLLTGTF